MRILVACEESQAVTIEFRKLGFEAYSCDILPCQGGHPEWHFMGDVTKLISINISDRQFQTEAGNYEVLSVSGWDAIIAFPPCTYLTVTGNRWFNVEKYGEKAVQRIKDREEAIKFFMLFANAECENIVIENPVGIMSSEWRKPNQIIQPWQFGDPYEKKTCLWIKGFDNLYPTNIVKPPERTTFESGKSMATWYADAFKLPPAERSKMRSKTFPGIAKAMAKQWGTYLKHKDLF